MAKPRSYFSHMNVIGFLLNQFWRVCLIVLFQIACLFLVVFLLKQEMTYICVNGYEDIMISIKFYMPAFCFAQLLETIISRIPYVKKVRVGLLGLMV